jgi:hypothetical protein
MRTAALALTAAATAVAALLAISMAPALTPATRAGLITATSTPTPAGSPTATPPPEPTGTATPYPPGTTLLRARVVDDRNGNGILDAGDVGLEGWYVRLSCGDFIRRSDPTDANGVTTSALFDKGPIDGVLSSCATPEHTLGWLPTAPNVRFHPIIEGQINDLTFLLHYLGPSVMETYASVVVRGIPTEATVTAAPPFTQCVEHPFDYGGSLLAIVGGADRAGCPQPGDTVALLVDGEPAGTLAFAPGSGSSQMLVVGGDSMRFWFPLDDYSGGAVPSISATVNSTQCAVVENIRTFGGGLAVYVLSDEARAGCGRPGDVVSFYRDGVLLEPELPWQAGWLSGPPDFVPAEGASHSITPPNTGSAGLAAAR